MKTKASVIVPVFNAFCWAKSINESIEQNLEAVGELILVNDGDTDDFTNLFKYLQESLRIPIASLHTLGKEGPGRARNIGLDHASLDYIAFLDTDDQWLPGSLQKRLDVLSRSNDYPFVYSSYNRIATDGQITNITFVPNFAALEYLYVTNFIATPSVVIRRSSLLGMRFKEIGHEDYEFWLRIIKMAGAPAIGFVDPIINVRTATGSASSVKKHAALWHYEILQNNGIPWAIRILLFVGYAINGVVKRKRYQYRPLFFGLNRIVGWWLSRQE